MGDMLCVDDDTLILMALCVAFVGAQTARTIAEAIAKAARLQPRVVLLDLALGREWGLDAIPMLLEVSPETRVIVFTAKTNNDLRRLAYAAGASAFVDKVHLPRIKEVVEDILTTPARHSGKRAALH